MRKNVYATTLLSFSLLIVCLTPVRAQLTLGDTLFAEPLVRSLIGNGVIISNIEFTCDTTIAIRQFDATNTNLNLGQGLLMTTGVADSAAAPNTLGGPYPGGNLGTSGYLPLDTLAGNSTFDACVIEFDLVPFCDSVGIQYVFASQEYNEFVNSPYNDVFAFFISGPGYSMTLPGDNIALVPGTALPVAIENVNNGNTPPGVISNGPCTNCGIYEDNTFGTSVEYDGFTVPLIAEASVVPCETYHITLAIADVFDPAYDSGVFLEAGGIGCLVPLLELEATNGTVLGDGILVEGCLDTGQFSFTLPVPLVDTGTFYLSYGGTATPGVDYLPLVDSIRIPGGAAGVTLPVIILNDGLQEGTETLVVYYEDTTLCSGLVYRDSAVMEIRDNPEEAPPLMDTLVCAQAAVQIGIAPEPGWGYEWEPDTGLSNPNIANPFFTWINATGQPDTLLYELIMYPIQGLPGICEQRDTAQIVVQPQDFSSIVLPTPSVCEGDSFTLGVTGTLPGVTALSWQIDGGPILVGPAPVYAFDTAGVFTLTAITTDGTCFDTTTSNLVVSPRPDASFSVLPVCMGDSSQFNLNVAPLPDQTYQWTLGDGNFSTTISPSHVYDSTGTYVVQHVVENLFGCTDTFTEVAVVSPHPTAGFTADGFCFGQTTQFTDTSVAGLSPISTYAWSLGDNGTSSLQNPTQTYLGPGIRQVRLIVTDTLGCSDTAISPIEIFAPPVADFTTDTACNGSPLTLTDDTQPGSGGLISWMWDLGDGAAANQPIVSHLYSGPDTFVVRLMVQDSLGCADTTSDLVVIFPIPVADFQTDPVCQDVAATFVLTAQNIASTYQWDFGDGRSSLQVNPVHEYAAPGTYEVTVVVRSAFGCSDTATDTALVYALPVANFRADTVCEDLPVSFTNLSMEGDFPLATSSWAFGDGSQDTSFSPQHTYDGFGLRNVTLTVADAFGCRADTSNLVWIHAAPIPAFVVDTVCSGQLTQYFDQSFVPDGSSVISRIWDFGDGSGGEGVTISHIYAGAGVYNVGLQVASSRGCTAQGVEPIFVYPRPEVDFEAFSVCERDTLYAEAMIVIDGAIAGDRVREWEWEWGDGSSSLSIPDPGHVYRNPGFYTITLRATSGRNCSNEISKRIEVYRQPSTPEVQTDTICVGDDGLLLTYSFGLRDTLLWYEDKGDSLPFQMGNTLLLENQLEPVTYYIEALSEDGCLSQRTPISLFIHPNAAPDIFPAEIRVQRPEALVNFAIGSRVPLTGFQWDMGDESKTTQPNPAHVYQQDGKFTVRVEVEDINGCSYSLSSQVEVVSVVQLHVPTAFSPNGDGKNDRFYLGQYNLRSLDFAIYNRWGQEVFRSTSPDFQWDGTGPGGAPLPEGVYTFRANALDFDGVPVEQSGTITLIR